MTRDRDLESFLNWEYEAADFLKAVVAGERDAWIIRRMGEQYPRDMDDREVISDIISAATNMFSMAIFQCTECGRIWLQRQGTEHFLSFLPEDEDWQDAI